MKKIFLFIILLVATWHFSIAQDSILSRIVLVGDGGQFTNGKHPVAAAIKKVIPMDSNTVVLFLGDNVYKVGLPDDQVITYNQSRSVLDSQVSIVDRTPARLFMIPGNHDWNNGGAAGFETVYREQLYFNIIGNPNVRFFPENGCPGPEEVEIDSSTVMILFDSQWWLHPYDKPGIESDCPFKTKDEVILQLRDLINKHYDKLVILATHHPFKSNGVHGGYFGPKQHIFPFTDMFKRLYIPLPIVGSIYPFVRSVIGTPQDLKHPVYQDMVNRMQDEVKSHPNLIFVAGHEHNLQLLQDSNHYYIVSGSGSKTSRVNKSRKSLHVEEEQGFVTLEISKNKNVRASIYTVTDSTRKVYSEPILNFAKLPSTGIPAPAPFEGAESLDTVRVPASQLYDSAGRFKRWVMGENYRKEWSTIVPMEVFHFDTVKGGMKITGLGGGKQTKSLKLVDKNGGEWTLRTIDKDPEKALPENFHNTLGSDIVQDLVSTAHPYSALVIPDLAKANGTIVAQPKFYFVPDDPILGFYRDWFGNTLCMFESRNPTHDGSESKSTGKLLEKMVEESDHRADQKAVLNARLLDMLVADWDRHFDQWRWGTKDTGKGRNYYPIPKDRDQALSWSDGLLVKYVANNRLPFLKGFRNDIPAINWLNWSARDFDKTFLNELSSEQWKELITKFQANLTDSVIQKAVSKMPSEIYSIRAGTIIQKLKDRRGLLLREGMRYYSFLSHYVKVIGSNKPEYFRISNDSDGKMKLSVYERIGGSDTAYKAYQRTFDLGDTKELHLYGLSGDDIFVTDENVRSRIKLRIIGGKGNDTFDLRGQVPAVLYDMDTSVNAVLHKNRARVYFSSLPEVNDFKWIEMEYPITRWPRVSIGFNSDDGLFAGGGFYRRTYGFRKVPFATENRFSAAYAFRGAFKLKYNGEFNQVFREKDLLIKAEYADPTLNNFFGLGNNTMLDKSRRLSYYLARFKYIDASVLLRWKPFRILGITAGPAFYHYWNKANDQKERILARPSLIGLDSSQVYSSKSYMGIKGGLDIYNLNSELFPTRGVHWITEVTLMAGLTTNSNPISKYTTDFTAYAPLSSSAKLIAVVRAGGGHIWNNNFEYFHALNLGTNNFLRGFRKNRFAGSGLMYGSLELRYRLLTSKWFILPGDFGIIGFGDAGRVWMKNESSKRWHTALGGGLYYVPFNMILISASMAYSKEETLFNVSIGTRLNFTF